MKKTYRSLSVFAVILMLVVSLGILSFAEDKVYKGTAELTISEPGRLFSGMDGSFQAGAPFYDFSL